MLLRQPRVYHLELPGHPLSPNRLLAASLRERLRDKRQWREAAAYASRAAHKGPPLRRAHVTITLVRRGGRARDPDGAIGSLKHVIDGLCVAHGGTLLVDDDAAHLTLEVRQQIGAARCVVIEIRESA